MSLALSMLLYDWRRFTAALAALAFSGLLILAQVGMFTGIVRSATATVDRSRADLIVLPPKTESLFNSSDSLPARVQPLLYLNPKVVEVAPLDANGARWVNRPEHGEKVVATFVQIFAVDTRAGSVGLPVDFPESIRLALTEPYAVVIDRTAQRPLGAHLNAAASLNGKGVKVRNLLATYPNVNQSVVYASRDTVRLLGLGAKPGKTGPLLVRLRDPTTAAQVVRQLNANAHGLYRVWTRDDLSRANEGALMKEQIIGIFLSFSIFLGFLIGVGITSQTLRGAILASIKEFASLRALGVSVGALRIVILELSWWLGVAGLIATALLTWLLWGLGSKFGLPMSFPPVWIIGVGLLLLGTSAASGLLAVGILKNSQPADLLR